MDNLIIKKINNYLSHELIEKAWIFGSFSRNEENENSDIDLLVQFSDNKKITLFYYLKLKDKLEKLTGKKVDLIEDGQLKNFAKDSFENDKILIYERKNQRQGEIESYHLESIDNIFEFTSKLRFEDFITNKMVKFAVIKNLEIIGEASNLLTLNLRNKNSQIEWNLIIGLRHILVHDYYQISDSIIWNTITEDLLDFRIKIQKILTDIKNED